MKQSTPESQVVNACLRWLWAHGCYVYRMNTGAYKPVNSNRYIRYGTPGCSDIVGLTPEGRALYVECKTAKGKLSPLQEVFRQRIKDHNGLYILARSIDDLEFRKDEIIAKHYAPAVAEGAEHDYRIRPSKHHARVFEEVTA